MRQGRGFRVLLVLRSWILGEQEREAGRARRAGPPSCGAPRAGLHEPRRGCRSRGGRAPRRQEARRRLHQSCHSRRPQGDRAPLRQERRRCRARSAVGRARRGRPWRVRDAGGEGWARRNTKPCPFRRRACAALS